MSDTPNKDEKQVESTSFEALIGEESEAPEEISPGQTQTERPPAHPPAQTEEPSAGTSFEDLGGAELETVAPPPDAEEGEAPKPKPQRPPVDDADAAFMEVEPAERKEPEMRAEALGASGGATPHWLTSLFSSILGIVLVGLVWSQVLGITLIALIGLLPVAYAVFVGIEGLLSNRPADERLKCFIGLGISLIAGLMALSIFFFPSS